LNPARLNELIHQRELLREHLAWLDREIARESGLGTTKPSSELLINAPVVASGSPSPLADSPISGLENYSAPDPKTTAADTKKGCLIAAMAVLTLLVAALVGIYFWKYRDRPLFFATPDTSAKGVTR
jgi:hypothetical protein